MPYCQVCQEDKYIVFRFPFEIEKEHETITHESNIEGDTTCFECLEKLERKDDSYGL
jgi:hypothetical protein